jgi:hypothetical protein
MATVTKQQIADFVAANLDNPQAIADAAAQYGVSSSDIASAMNVDVGAVTNYFSNAAVAPPPVEIAPTPAPNQFVASTAPGSVGTSYGQASGDLIGQVQQQNPELATALQTGTASVGFNADTGTSTLINTQTGAPIGGDYQVQVGTNGVGINIPTASGAVVQASVTTDQSGKIAPVTASQVFNTGLNAGAGGFAGGGQLMQQAVAIGLAYALPIAGEAISASLSTAAFAVPSYVGTALASISLGVAQGQTLEQAITNAAPSLLSAGIMDQTGLSKLSLDITSNPQFQNVINNMAGSMIATASKGGTVTEMLTNAAAAGGGTLIGNNLQLDGVSPSNAQAVGSAIAGNIATGTTLGGLTAGAGSLGGAQARQNAATKTTPTTTTTPVATSEAATDINNLNQQLYSAQSTAFVGPGLGPQATQTVADLTNQILSKLQAAALNPATSAQELQTLAQSASRFIDPAVFGRAVGVIGLLLTPSAAGDATEQAQVDAKYKALSDISQQVNGTAPLSPLPSITLPPAPVVTPVTADVANVATALNISNDEALLLQQTNPNLFSNIAGKGNEQAFIPADPAVMRSTDLVVGQTGGANDNIILASGKKPTTTLESPVTTPTATTVPENQLVITTDPATQTALVINPTGTMTIVSTVNQTVTPGQSVSVDPSSKTIVSTTPTTTTAPAPQPSQQPTSSVSPTTTTQTATTTTPSVQPQTQTPSVRQPSTSPLATPTTDTLSTPSTSPLTQPQTSTSPKVTQPTSVTQQTTSALPTPTTPPVVPIAPPVNQTTTTPPSTKTTDITVETPTTLTATTPESPITPTTSPAVSSKTTPSKKPDEPITITTSVVKPPTIKAALPTIYGQFASPLTPAVSAFTPAGEIPGQETGKPREDVWNQESLREGLGL